MRIRWHLFGIGIACLVSIICLGIIIYVTTPETASVSLKILFFLSLYVGLWTLVTLAIVSIRHGIKKNDPDSLMIPSLAQAFFLSAITMLILLIRQLI